MKHENLQDANQKYGQSVVALLDEKHIPFYVDHCDEGLVNVDFRGQVTDGKVWTPHHCTAPDAPLILDLPDVGAINVKDTVLYLWRVPRRQWCRGFSDGTINHFCVNRVEYNMIGRRAPPLMHPEALWHVYNPEWPMVEDAFKQVDSLDYLARAWNYKYYFAVKKGAPKILVGHKNALVGWAEDERNVVLHQQFEHLAEELGQYVKIEVSHAEPAVDEEAARVEGAEEEW